MARRCNDCIHVKICQTTRIMNPTHNYALECINFADRSRFVELPCNVGDSVFTIDEKGNIQECTVINVNCKIQMTLDKKLWTDFIIATEPEDDSLPFPMIFTYSITKNRILFLTRESAEQTLKEREENA